MERRSGGEVASRCRWAAQPRDELDAVLKGGPEGGIERDRAVECGERLLRGQLRLGPRAPVKRQFPLVIPGFRVLGKAADRFGKRAEESLIKGIEFRRPVPALEGAPQRIGYHQQALPGR